MGDGNTNIFLENQMALINNIDLATAKIKKGKNKENDPNNMTKKKRELQKKKKEEEKKMTDLKVVTGLSC